LISVADNGIGFEPGYAAKIFELFRRLYGRDIPGTGLGLTPNPCT
jgi:signal transduction histidine kinase